MHPPREPVTRDGLDAELAPARDVEFRTEDAQTLRGWYVPSRNRAAVLLAHGYGGNRMQMIPEARLLAGRGYGVLLFDLRAHGQSDGDRSTYGDKERLDIRAAADFLSSQPDVDANRLGALGFSAGAPPVAQASASDGRIRAVVLEASTTSMVAACLDERGRFGWLTLGPALLGVLATGVDWDGYRALDAVGKISPRSLLVVQGDQDRIVAPKRAQALFDAASQPKRLLMIHGAGHGDYFSAASREYPDALLSHFDEALLTHPIATPSN